MAISRAMRPTTMSRRPSCLTFDSVFALRPKIWGIDGLKALPDLRALKAAVKRARACATIVKHGPRPANRVCTTLVKKGSSDGPGINLAYNPFVKRGFRLLQKGRDERAKVPSAGLSGRQLRPPQAGWSAAHRRPPRTRARRSCRSPAHLPGRPSQHQHAGLPGSGSLRAVRIRDRSRDLDGDQVPPVCRGPADVRAVRVVRSGQPLRVHGARARARVAEERA